MASKTVTLCDANNCRVSGAEHVCFLAERYTDAAGSGDNRTWEGDLCPFHMRAMLTAAMTLLKKLAPPDELISFCTRFGLEKLD